MPGYAASNARIISEHLIGIICKEVTVFRFYSQSINLY